MSKKNWLVFVAAIVLCGASFAAENFVDTVFRVETWINDRYAVGSVARDASLQKLRAVIATSLTDAEKIEELKREFPSAFRGATSGKRASFLGALHRKAAAGDVNAQYNLAVRYYLGHGVKKDVQEATKWWLKAAEQGDVESQFRVGWLYMEANRSDSAEAVKWYTKAAEAGHAAAQNCVGVAFCIGDRNSVKKDPAKAFYWFGKAAAQGNPEAQCNLASCYSEGIGVDADPRKAVYWYRKAAEQGEYRAQHYLGNCYHFGRGVKKDLKKAAFWYRKAAEKGEHGAQSSLGAYYRFGWGGLKKDPAKAVEWWRKAGDWTGEVDAQFNLGVCYYFGDGVNKDIVQAVKWWGKAAERGYQKAREYLEKCRNSPESIKKVTVMVKSSPGWISAFSSPVLR